MKLQQLNHKSRLRRFFMLILLPITIPTFIIGWILAQTSQSKQIGTIKESHKFSSIKIQIINKAPIKTREKIQENHPMAT